MIPETGKCVLRPVKKCSSILPMKHYQLPGHNYPSGTAYPSEADQKITKKIVNAGLLLEIAVLDHLIVQMMVLFICR